MDDDVVALESGQLGNAGAHGAGPDDADPLDLGQSGAVRGGGQLAGRFLLEEDADQVVAGVARGQPAGGGTLLGQPRRQAVPDAGADRFQGFDRGRHVVRRPPPHQAVGPTQQDAPADGVRLEQPLPPGQERQALVLPFAVPQGLFDQGAELLAQALVAGGHGIGQAAAQGVAGRQALAAQDQLQGALQADHAHQPLCAAPAGQQAQLDFGQPQLGRGLVVDQPVIAGQGKLQPASQARAADHRQGRHRQRRQLVENRLALGGNRLGLRRGLDLEEVVKIGPGRETR